MTAILVEQQQWLDDQGDPLVNASIYIGQQNLNPITNPVTIYSDRALTVPIANPQLTGLDGRSVNKIWVDGAYSIEVQDSMAVQVYQELDNGGSATAAAGVNRLINVVGNNTITANGNPTVTSLTDKALYSFTVQAANTGPVTLNIDGLGAKDIVSSAGNALVSGDLTGDVNAIINYNLAQDRFELINQLDISDEVSEAVVGNVVFQLVNMTEGLVVTEGCRGFASDQVNQGESFPTIIAVGENDGTRPPIHRTIDYGLSWTTFNPPNNAGIDANDATYDGSRFLVVGDADGAEALMYWSNDGTTWFNSNSNPKNFDLNSCVFGAGQGIVCVGESDGVDTYIVTASAANLAFTERVSPVNLEMNHVDYGNGVFIAVGSNDGVEPVIIRSIDAGASWSQVSSGISGVTTGQFFQCATNGNGVWIATGNNDLGDAMLARSVDDGLTWIDITATLPAVLLSESFAYCAYHQSQDCFMFVGTADLNFPVAVATRDFVNYNVGSRVTTPLGGHQNLNYHWGLILARSNTDLRQSQLRL